MKNIVFVTTTQEGTARHRGDQVAEKLSAAGFQASVCGEAQAFVGKLQDTIFVFVKHFKSNLAREIRSRGGLIVWDILEKRAHQIRSHPFGRDVVDGVIFGNRETMEAVDDSLPSSIVRDYIYHYSFDVLTVEERPFGVVYCGAKGGEGIVKDLPQIECNYFELEMFDRPKYLCGYLKRASGYPFHFSIRDTPFKPPTKISFAARCGSNIIINREAGGVIEMLGEDYPYLWDGKQHIQEMIGHAHETYLSDAWYEGLSRMEKVLKVSSDEAITEKYRQFFERVEILACRKQ